MMFRDLGAEYRVCSPARWENDVWPVSMEMYSKACWLVAVPASASDEV